MKPTKIKHIPYGLSPYKKAGYERVPGDPYEGENVVVNAIVDSFLITPGLFLKWKLNGVKQEKKLPAAIKENDGKFYYAFELGGFNESDTVAYSFGTEEGNELVQSEEFKFCVLKNYKLGELVSLKNIDNILELDFTSESNYESKMYLCFEKGSLRMYYTLEQFSFGSKCNCSFIELDQNYFIYKDNENGNYVEIYKNPFKLIIRNAKNNVLLSSGDPQNFIDLASNSKGDFLSLRFNFLACNSYYYGFGERFDSVNQSGKCPDVHVLEQFTNQRNITYMPMPFFLTEKNYGMFIHSSFYTSYSLAMEMENHLSIETKINRGSPFANIYIFFGTPIEIIRTYSELTGKPQLSPKWAFGPWISSNRWNSQKETLKQVDLTLKQDIPATVVVLEAWSDEVTHYIFNDAQYQSQDGNEFFSYSDFTFSENGLWPNPKQMIDYLHGNNMKLILWLVPVVKYVKDSDNEQHMIDEEYAIRSGFCVQNKDGSPYRITDNWFCNSLLPDYTNPDAKSWWMKKRGYLIEDLGVDGFKTDGSEFIYHDDLRFFNGKSGDEMRNRYPIEFFSAFHEFMGPDRITFSRAGFTGAQQYPMYWAGDQESTFSELRSVLNAGLSINLSGNPLWGFDIAGFYGAMPGYELYARSTELAAFSPVMQYHSAPTNDGINNDRTPWNVSEWNNDNRVLELYKKYANIRMNLLPYIYQEAQYITGNCEPLMRHLVVDFPADEKVYGIDDQYMFGRSLLIAPVITEGCTSRSIYLPEGEWTDFWDGTRYTGQSYIDYQCGIEKIPVFIKNNSVIPLNLDNNFQIGGYIGNSISCYNKLCFVIAGQMKGEYQFNDDLGNNIILSENIHAKISGNIDKIYVFCQSPVSPERKYIGIKLNDANYNMCILERED